MNQREISNSVEKEKKRAVIFVQSGNNCEHHTTIFENFLQTFQGRDNLSNKIRTEANAIFDDLPFPPSY